MDKKTPKNRNVREYRHAQLQDLIRDLIRHRDHVQGAIVEIELQLGKLGKVSRRTDALEMTQRLIEKDIALLRGINGDLARIIDELPYRVKGAHFRILNSIYATACEELEKADISRLLDEVPTKGTDRKLAKLIDEASGQYLSAVHSLLVLKDINSRLKTFFGHRSGQENSSTVKTISPITPDLEIPAETRWENLRLEFQDIEELSIKINYRPFGLKNYRTLGFENRAAAGETSRAGKPNRLWRTLALFARCEGIVSWDNIGPREAKKLVKNVSDLRRHLKAVFGLAGQPIARYATRRRSDGDRRKAGYSTVFEIVPIDDEQFQRIADWVGGEGSFSATVIQGEDIDRDEIS